MENLCNVPSISELLDSNFNISDNILDAFYGQAPQPKSPDEVPDYYACKILGKINHFNFPFKEWVYGAPVYCLAWEILELNMNDCRNEPDGYYKNYTKERVFEALKDYAKGFQYGFDNFIKDKIQKSTSLQNSEISKADRIMDFLSTSGFTRPTFSESHPEPFLNWHNDGIIAGYFYCAWYMIIDNHRLFEPFFKTLPPQQNEKESKQPSPEIKPKLKPEFVQAVFDLLKDFFSLEHQIKLKEILETGNNANEKLIFLDNGNRLADSFKQLIKSDVITGCEQKELETWIFNNFQYRFRKEIKNFKPRYLNDIISTKKDLCQNPIFNVKSERSTGKILITKA